jgi:hypothetical protein
MNRIKDDERASLGDVMLDNLLMLSQNGPALQEMDFHKAVYWWFVRGNRRESLGAGILSELEAAHGQPPPLDVPAVHPAAPQAAAAAEPAPDAAPAVAAGPRMVIDLVVEDVAPNEHAGQPAQPAVPVDG